MSDILGRGWAFPVGVDARGRIAMAGGVEDIEQAMIMILLTPKSHRVMRPEFGSRLHELVFAPNDANTTGLAVSYVEEALRMWEPRIELQRVQASADPQSPERLLIHIEYQVRSTHDRRSLVFPFYRIPGEPTLEEVPGGAP